MDDFTTVAYRKKLGQDVWHWCRTCPDWPRYSDSIESLSPPGPEDRCPECLVIDIGPEQCEPNPA